MKNELAFNSEKDALEVAAILMRNDYCVLLSKEDDLTVLNYEYSQYCDRNDVVFMSAEEFDSITKWRAKKMKTLDKSLIL